jgi:hypothetical protein
MGVAISGFCPHHITGLIRVITPKKQIQEFTFGALVRRENRGADRVWGQGKRPPPNRLGGLWERRELPQRGPGRIPGRQRFWCI